MPEATKYQKTTLILGLGVLSFLAVLLYFAFNPEKGFLYPKCPVHSYMGIHCAGCGSQRAFHDLLHLRFKEAIGHNALLLPALIVIIQHLGSRFGVLKQKSFLDFRYAPIILFVVILLFMVLRNIKSFPFYHLAP